ncbi:MAG: transposase [Deltaproteobacteria bacterium]|jgi:transposase|nr:transposase [Deltaproteobacteria bacterium]
MLIPRMKRSRLASIIAAIKTLIAHKDGIVACFNKPLAQAILEGIDSVIKHAKRGGEAFTFSKVRYDPSRCRKTLS